MHHFTAVHWCENVCVKTVNSGYIYRPYCTFYSGGTFLRRHFGLFNPSETFECFPKVLGIIKMSCGGCETRRFVLCSHQWFSHWNTSMDAIYVQSLSYCLIMNSDWGEWGLQFVNVVLGSLWPPGWVIDALNVGRPATPGKVHDCYKFFSNCG